ncbi:MAG: fibronectin type III domain-containing protein, partial [Bacteroidales bacterium]|nr:fibronectin type III domain-containing protein [Bacteroidales bacterium]
RVEFYMYVPAENTGYYNILQDNNGSDSKWGIQLTFNDSEITIDANGNQYYHLYDPDSWMRIIHYIDLDNDWADIYLDDELLVAYQWSKGQNGDGTTCKFDAIDFYSQTSNNQSGLFYIDDITISQVSATDAPTNLTATVQNELDVHLSWTAVDNEIYVDHYSIIRDGYEIAATTETTYIDEHLYPMTYNYQVRAYCGTEIVYSASSNTAQATIEGGIERENVLVEIFSRSGCTSSPYAAKALDDMEASDSLDIIVLDHHIADTYGNTQSYARFHYWADRDNMYGQNYGFEGTPSTVFDGYIGLAGASTNVTDMQNTYATYYNYVKDIKSIYSLTAELEQTEFNGRTFSLNVTAEKHSEYFGDDQIVVMAALAEDIDYDWSVAGKINNLVRVLYPDANGTEATFDGNNRFSTSFSITISEEYDISKCKVVVWVENHTQGRVMHTKRFNVMDFYNITAQQFTITVLANNDAYGMVSGGGTYDEGTEITLIAMPNQGYLFDSWEDGNFDNPRSIEVTSDSTFIADFIKCEITYAIDTVVNNFVTVGDHTFYSTGNYTFAVSHETACDTIYDIRLRVLAEPVYDISPNPTKSILNINSDGFISAVEFYTTTGQLVMRKEVNGYEAEF